MAGINVGRCCDRYDFNFGKNEVTEPLDENEPVFDFSAEGNRLGPSRYDNQLYEKDVIDTTENIFNNKHS